MHTDGQTEMFEQAEFILHTALRLSLSVHVSKEKEESTPVPLPNHHATTQKKKSEGCGLSVPCIPMGILKTEVYLWGAISTLACCGILV